MGIAQVVAPTLGGKNTNPLLINAFLILRRCFHRQVDLAMVFLDQPAFRRRHFPHRHLPPQSPAISPTTASRPQSTSPKFRSCRNLYLHSMGYLPPPRPSMGRRQVLLVVMAHHSAAGPLQHPLPHMVILAMVPGRQSHASFPRHASAQSSGWKLVYILPLWRILHHCILRSYLVSECARCVSVRLWHQSAG